MPALKACGVKWRVGSDDFVFPYTFSILLRFLWFGSIGYMLVDYDKEYYCDDEKLLKIYLIVLLGVHVLMALVEMVVVLISTRGTIADPSPRRWLSWALYVQILLSVGELAWDCVGVVWAFDPSIDCSYSHKVLVYVRIVLVWNLFTTLVIGSYLFIRIGICQLCCRRTPRRLRYEPLIPEVDHGGRRLSRISSTSLKHHARQRTWQWRLQSLFCCLRFKIGQRSVFSEVSATLADAFTYFRGYVPSDVLAGMALVALEQKPNENPFNYPESEREWLDYDDLDVRIHARKMKRYLKFSGGAYGWAFYVFKKGLRGMFSLMCLMCLRKKRKEIKTEPGKMEEGKKPEVTGRKITGDNSCKWETSCVMRWSGCKESDILFASFKSEVFCPAFYVVLDHKEKSVVVTIRGTLSFMDVLTDLSAQPGLLTTIDKEKLYAHRGMLNTAEAMKTKLEGEGILHRAFKQYPHYRLVITGHSLGAGTASLLAVLLHPVYKKLHCYAFAPPGGLISKSAIPFTRQFITSIVLGSDLVPRLSLQNFEEFGKRVLHRIRTNQLPKYQIFLKSFCHWIGICKSRGYRRVANSNEDTIKTEPQQEPNRTNHRITDPVTGKQVLAAPERMDLYLPGNIVYLNLGPVEKTCWGLCKKQPVLSHWATQEEFSELIIDKNMVSDHMPDRMLDVMTKLSKQEKI